MSKARPKTIEDVRAIVESETTAALVRMAEVGWNGESWIARAAREAVESATRAALGLERDHMNKWRLRSGEIQERINAVVSEVADKISELAMAPLTDKEIGAIVRSARIEYAEAVGHRVREIARERAEEDAAKMFDELLRGVDR